METFYKNRIVFLHQKNHCKRQREYPQKGAVLFAVNHPNGLIDPLLVTTNLPRVNHYLVRAAVFKKPLIKKLLGTLNLMPIYRIRDGVSNLGKNQEIFEDCFTIFRKGKTLMIFPEGSHNRKRTIRPLSKGFTRIVFGAFEKHKDLKITIIPVGITYQNASKFPAKVAIHFGEPILANEYYNANKLNISVVQLKNEVSYQLKKLSVHIHDDTNYEATLTKLNEAQVDFTKVTEVNNMITANNIPPIEKPRKNKLQFLWLLIVINGIIPFLIWKRVAKKIDEIEFVDTFRYGINTLTFPIFYALQTWVIGYFFGFKNGLLYLLISLLLLLVYVKSSPTNTEA